MRDMCINYFDLSRRVSLFGGMEWWNGTVEWNSGMVEYWNGGITTPTSGTTISYFKPLLLLNVTSLEMIQLKKRIWASLRLKST